LKNIFIVHFQPIESYPPVMNLLNCLKNEPGNFRIFVYTNEPDRSVNRYIPQSDKIQIFRVSKMPAKKASFFVKIPSYLSFYLKTSFAIQIKKPKAVLMYETLSLLPAYLSSLFKKKLPLFYIHYHEYTSPYEYQTAPFLLKINSLIERKIVLMSHWVSHTNYERLRLFMADFKLNASTKYKALPNYPPAAWKFYQKEDKINREVTHVVYVGAVDLDTMYFKEFANWVVQNTGKIKWDIYSQQNTKEIKNFLFSLNTSNIEVKDQVTYFDLPKVLNNYDAGVILYKGHNENYIHNAPNKLFEYLAVGLSVWYPIEVKGVDFYRAGDVVPQVLQLDFSNLWKYNPVNLKIPQGLRRRKDEFFCEDVYKELSRQLIDP
jgi:hypothetical protein